VTEFLIRRFAAGDNMDEVRQRCGRLGGVVGILVNLLLSAGKLAAGLLAGSVAITADAVNNLSDAGSSVISLVSFRLAARPADKEHPFGHARIEYVASMVVAGLILLLGVELLRSSVERIITPEETAFSWLTVGVLVFSILMKLWLYRFNITMGRRIGSQLMEATAADSLSDVLATGGVLLSTILSPLLGVPLDGWMGLVVAVFILRSGVGIIREALDKLLGEAPTGELVREIEDYVRSYDGVVDCHDLVVHSYGPGRCFASVHAEVPANSDIMASHDIIDNIERDILRDKNIHLVIHMDPVVVDDANVDRRREQVRQVLAGISGELSFHDFRMVSGPTHTNMIFDVVAPFGLPISDSELCRRIQEGVRALDPTLYTVVTVDRQG
jgi:cation diffusion facilitator family transporter